MAGERITDCNQEKNSTEEMLTVNDVARLLHVHPNSVRRWADMGLLRSYRVGLRGDRRFSPGDVARFLRSWPKS